MPSSDFLGSQVYVVMECTELKYRKSDYCLSQITYPGYLLRWKELSEVGGGYVEGTENKLIVPWVYIRLACFLRYSFL